MAKSITFLIVNNQMPSTVKNNKSVVYDFCRELIFILDLTNFESCPV